MKNYNPITELSEQNFHNNVYDEFRILTINNIELAAEKFLYGLSQHFDLGEVEFSQNTILKLKDLFENTKNSISEEGMIMFTEVLAAIWGQVLVSNYDGKWAESTHPQDSATFLAVYYYNSGPQVLFPFVRAAKHINEWTLYTLTMDKFLELGRHEQWGIVYRNSDSCKIGERTTEEYNVALLQINEFYIEFYVHREYVFDEYFTVFDSSSPKLDHYLAMIDITGIGS